MDYAEARTRAPLRRKAETTCVSEGPYWFSRTQPGSFSKKAMSAGVTWSCSPAVTTPAQREGSVAL